MKAFYVTTTEHQADDLMKEILRVDTDAVISHRQDNKTLLLVQSEKMSIWSFEAMAGVAHALNMTAMVAALK